MRKPENECPVVPAKSLSVSRVSDSIFGEGAHSSLGLEGLLLLLEKINLLQGWLGSGDKHWCQHEVMWLEDSLVSLIDLEPLPFLPGLLVSVPIIPTF